MSEPETPRTRDTKVLLQARLFRVIEETYETGDGEEHVQQIVRHPGAVAIVPVLDDGRICLIQNYRQSAREFLLEIPAGTREPNEEPLETARRELIEETGYRAKKIEKLAQFFMSPGILDEQMHLFLATGLTPGESDLQAGELIVPRLVTWGEACDMIRSGTIRDSKTLVGLLYYGTFVR
jgi:ADP-ribose pyrophosphatase